MSEEIVTDLGDLKPKLLALGIKSFRIEWSGGSDEGFLEVYVYTDEEQTESGHENGAARAAHKMITEWANDAWAYSGAGDGTSYGDNFTYYLVSCRVECEEWYHQPVYEDTVTMDLTG